MNKNSLLYKIITNLATVLAVILVVSSICLTFAYNNILYSYKYKQIDKESDIISKMVISCFSEEKEVNHEELQRFINYVKEVEGVDVYICDSVEMLFAWSENNTDISESKLNISNEYIEKLKNGKTIKYGEIKLKNEELDTFLKPIINKDGQYYGSIALVIDSSQMDEILFKGYKVIWITTLIVLIITIFFSNHFTKKQLINPLKEIYLVANKLARGEVENRLEVKSNDEIGELAKSFNLMAESLEAIESNRRDFISNVSHELRSPITSMKGFIAGMLDGVIPKDKENYYLKLVYDEINRLSRLVNDLLDISSMEVGKFKLTIIEIDINSLIKRCLLNIESKVREKGIHVNASLENEHLFVYADSDRIMQVLTNLLDNAIKYGGDNGIINVSTRIKGPKVHVSVYNKGLNMSEEEMAHIWDRFYKSDKSRTNKESTGLGLPIVRLIMTQHKEDIWVKNEREGVVFTFTLAKV